MSMILDATLFVFLSTLPIIVAMFASDEAGKYLSAETLFWIKNSLAALGAAVGSVKAFRSLSFANHLHQKQLKNGNGNGGTELLNKVAGSSIAGRVD